MATQSTWRTNGPPRWGPGSEAKANSNANSNARPSQAQADKEVHGSGANAVATTQQSAPGASNKGASATPYANVLAAAKASSNAETTKDDSTAQQDRLMYLLVALVGNTVIATTRSRVKYVGILSTTSAKENGKANGSLGIVLTCAQQILPDNTLGSVKKTLLIKGDDLESFVAHEVALDVPVSTAMSNNGRNTAGFRTDTEISNVKANEGQGRTLHKWTGGPETDLSLEAGDDAGARGASNKALGSWDQFAANEAKFGIKSNYDESMYTTRLDKSGTDYKDRERKADQLAREIMSSSTSNIHIAEERNLVEPAGEAGQDEEDKYGAVARAANAYVPPGARRAAAAAAANASVAARINGANATEKVDSDTAPGAPSIVTTAPSAASPALGTSKADDASSTEKQQQQDAVGEFRQFVSNERERAERKKAALAKKEKESMLAGLKSWSDKFKLKYPVPADVAMVSRSQSQDKDSAKNEIEQVSEKPRDPSLQKSLSPTPSHTPKVVTVAGEGAASLNKDAAGGSASAMHSPSTTSSARYSIAGAPPQGGATAGSTNAAKAMLASMSVAKIPPFTGGDKSKGRQAGASGTGNAQSSSKPQYFSTMKIPTIPPFNPDKSRLRQAEAQSSTGLTDRGADVKFNASGSVELPAANAAPKTTTKPEQAASTTTSKSAFKMSAKASTFTPFNPNAASFTPGASTTASSRVSAEASPGLGSPAGRVAASQPSEPVISHPFFGSRVIKRSTTKPSQIREDFTPFKSNESNVLSEASTVGPTWVFTGKPYRALFHVIPANGEKGGPGMTSPQQGAHPAPHVGHMQSGVGMNGGMMTPGMLGQPQPLPGHVPQGHMPHQQQPGGQHVGQHGHNAAGLPLGAMPGAGGQPIYLPYGPYRFAAGQQPPVQHLGGPYMAPHFMGQMPFSPPMPPNGPPGGAMYSPQMQNMVPAGAQPPPPLPNMVMGGAGTGGGPNAPVSGVAQPSQGQSQRTASAAGPHAGLPPGVAQMQAGAGKAPPHVYYPATVAQPMSGMGYGGPPSFHHPPSAGPSPIIRHQQQQPHHHAPPQPHYPSRNAAQQQAQPLSQQTSSSGTSSANGNAPSDSASTTTKS